MLCNSAVPTFLGLLNCSRSGLAVFFFSVFSILFSSTRARPVLVKQCDIFSLLGKQMDILFQENCTLLERFSEG